MIEALIEYSLKNRLIIIVFSLIFAVLGIRAMGTINLDAIPDLSDTQVIVFTEFPGQSPQVVEDQVTYPLTSAMLAVPFAKNVRGYSFFGFSMVYIIFDDGTDLYWARSRVVELLNYVSGRLPGGVTPQLGPDATGVGWVYQYVLDVSPEYEGQYDLSELRSIQDWYLKYELTAIPGVSEIASIGGFVKQYQVTLNPDALQAFGISPSQVSMAIKNSNQDVGGRLIEQAEREFMVRGLGYIEGVDDISNIAVGADSDGTPILLRQIANVDIGPEIRRGLATWNDEGETVGGIVVMRSGENALKVIDAVKDRIEELKKGLPPGIEIVPAYDRSELIEKTVDNLTHKLIEEIVVVALVCIVFLLHFRSSLVSIVTLPLGILISVALMEFFGIAANVMSLGGIAIAIGVMVDAAVVLVENTHKHLERDEGRKSHFNIVLDASKEVGPALFYSLIIITVSFLPVFVLGEQSGRLFKPLAYTKTFAMASSSLIAVTVIPVLLYYFVKGGIRPESQNPISRFLIKIYRPALAWLLKRKMQTIGATLLILILTIFPLSQLGSEFMPPLNEGDILYMPTTDPGISITKARELLQQTNRMILQVPEVNTVFGKIGRAETATDPAPLAMIETIITLKPKSEWRPGMTTDKIIDELNRTVDIPGLTNAWTMPIRTRIDMLSTGIKTPVGIKIMGDDLKTLAALAQQISSEITPISGVLSSFPEKAFGGNYFDIDIDREAIARYGLTISDVQSVIMSALGGMNVTRTVEGIERYPVNVRYPRDYRDDLDSIKRILVPVPGGMVPLEQLADLRYSQGPPMIKTENARRTAWIYVDIHGRDVGGFVEEAKTLIEDKINSGEIVLPPGYSIKWSGQYEYMEKAAATLKVVIPLTLAIIFLLLYFHFRSMTQTLIVMLTLPFAVVGGIWLLFILGYNTSVAVWVGFIALAGLAAETGIVMLVYVDIAVRNAIREGRMRSIEDLNHAIIEGAVERVRPKMMTVMTTFIGLLPIMFGTETGSEVMKRIASPMVGGLFSATVLTLFIIPVVYAVVRRSLVPDAELLETETRD
ncbi:MAG TPA: CusA/CzcA family heavy metal efflux RND transporter [bacterium]|jgi:Cu(I)/Ag(I) efflux system membrane protein CusA/SilA